MSLGPSSSSSHSRFLIGYPPNSDPTGSPTFELTDSSDSYTQLCAGIVITVIVLGPLCYILGSACKPVLEFLDGTPRRNPTVFSV